MANLDYPRGCILVKGDETADTYTIAPTNTAIGVNDPLEMRSDGYVWQAQAGSTTIIGIAAEAKAASTGGSILVYDDPLIEFQMQVNDANVNVQTDLGLAYDIVIGAPVRGSSIAEIDGTTGAVTATLPIKPLRVSQIITKNGNVFGANVLLDCKFNQHFNKAGSVGI